MPTVPGMGRGNSGSGTDGLTGWSARMNYDRRPTPGSPVENFRAFGTGDMYIPDNTASHFGTDAGKWLNHYLSYQRKGVWFCVEQRVKLNSVTQPSELQRHLLQIENNNDNTATATFLEPQSGPHWVTGAIWTFGGAGILGIDGFQYFGFNRSGVPITVLNSTQCTYPISGPLGPICKIGQPPVLGPPPLPQSVSTSIGRGPVDLVWLTACPGQGNHDGVLQGWVNGRLAQNLPGMRFRHSRWLTDGSGLLGINTAWFTVFQGGGGLPTTDSSLYLADMIVAKSYIGPMVGYP
jgi:hypothetical protein